MSDYSTTTGPILDLIAGDCWARHQLPNSVRSIPPRTLFMKLQGWMESWRSQNSMIDSSTTTAPILDLIAGDCRAWRQLRSGIKDISVASEPMKSLTIMVGVIFRGPLALPALDVRFLHNHSSDPRSDCGRLLASKPAWKWYKIFSPATFIHEVTVSRIGVEYRVKVESRVGQPEVLHMSIMISPVY